MEKLVAVKIEDVGDMLLVTGYVARKKNRKRVMHFLVPEAEKDLIPGLVEAAEKTRKDLDKA